MVFLPKQEDKQSRAFVPAYSLEKPVNNKYVMADMNAVSLAHSLSTDWTVEPDGDPNESVRRITETYMATRDIVKEQGDRELEKRAQLDAHKATQESMKELFNVAMADQIVDKGIQIAEAYNRLGEAEAEEAERAAVQRQAIERMVELRRETGEPIDVRATDVLQRSMEDRARSLVMSKYLAKAKKKAKDEDGWLGDTIDAILYILPFQDGFTNYRMTESYTAPFLFGDSMRDMAREFNRMTPDQVANWFENNWDGLFDRTGVIFENPDKAAEWIEDVVYYDDDRGETANFWSLVGTAFALGSTAGLVKWGTMGTKQLHAGRILNKELKEKEHIPVKVKDRTEIKDKSVDPVEEVAERTKDVKEIQATERAVRKNREKLDKEISKVQKQLDEVEAKLPKEKPKAKGKKKTTAPRKEFFKKPTPAMIKKAEKARPSTIEKWKISGATVGRLIDEGKIPSPKDVENLRMYRAYLDTARDAPSANLRKYPADVINAKMDELTEKLRVIQKKRQDYVC